MKTKVLFLTFTIASIISSCSKDPGCTDPSADNYNSLAEVNDGSCQYSGDAIFWMSDALNYVNVTTNGITKTITHYYPSGGVNCGSSGCANFHLPVGTYSYFAEEEGIFGLTWSGSFTIVKNTCRSLKLTP